jgi:hypothetical protein
MDGRSYVFERSRVRCGDKHAHKIGPFGAAFQQLAGNFTNGGRWNRVF